MTEIYMYRVITHGEDEYYSRYVSAIKVLRSFSQRMIDAPRDESHARPASSLTKCEHPCEVGSNIFAVRGDCS